ncbi:hypothetical protein FH609_007550 [Streptomyces sp. 3MP-14]|uniref:Uncharacterized protein n=1 Tax=Streptomyces mimosae TaxID=2586635 RepID=A0A5N6AKU0_9ACTN|nr:MULTISPECIES: hypothetical protein [Streptomyces]KAB8168742.1 hypothetical protein FH607_005815 [Streptomyces mimosae]KAB8177978.1 hypothetical protein FH609_007550 [Streptomyces sp. 3MP-14]
MRIGITGHRGLPEAIATRVRAGLRAELARHAPHGLVGVSCLADGPDSWFARTVLELGGRVEVVIPADDYRSVLPAWHHPEYDALVAAADAVHRTGLATADDRAFMTASEVMVGLVDRLLAVWDGEPARGFGGSADVVAYAHRVALPVRVLWPEGAVRG